MQCPQCGASTDPTKPQCQYCSSALALARCPRCFGMVFTGARHCRHCGVRVEEPAVRHMREDREESRPCPRCKGQDLEGLLAGDMLVDHCEKCGGLWLDHAVFEKIQESEEIRAPAMLSLASLPKPESEAPPHGYIPCPDCEKLMTPKNFARRSGIIIDHCKAHGTWFDAGELPAIVDYIRGGGLEQSRRREMEDLKAEQRKTQMDKVFAQQQMNRTHRHGAGPVFLIGEADPIGSPLVRFLIGFLSR